MSAGDWPRVKELLAGALARAPEERTNYLREACGGDEALEARVADLLELDDPAASFFEPATALSRPQSAETRTTDTDDRKIGRYTVRRSIAAGGMGVVYEAVQDHPHRLVALKVMRHGAASRAALGRFRHESEILGRLQHPNIAQVYDAGTFDEGHGVQPYFAMEFIRGRPLLEYAEVKGLGTRERLGLFIKICDAVQYAHHKGVIHRDLKPDNVLVDDLGEPKVLDFGVARATDADIQVTTLRTDIGQLIGTVPYMSPEQVTGDPHELDTRSDIYSLGVVLYELMCGRLPHDLKEKSIPEAARVIREEDPTPLSSVNRVFRGDIETIVAKALAKEKDRRYQTAAELAADLRHYLADEPIVARPPSTFYQLRKFARRNKALVGGVSVAFAALALGTVVATWQAVNARAEAATSAAINEYLMRLFAMANPAEAADELAEFGGGRVRTLEELVDEASRELETALPQSRELQAEMHSRLGRTYWGLGRSRKSGSHLHRARELYTESLGADDPATLVSQVWYARWLSEAQLRHAEAEPLLRRAVEDLARVCGRGDPRTLTAATWRAANLVRLGQYREGEELSLETIETARRELGEQNKVTLTAMHRYAVHLQMMRRFREGERWLAGALDASRRRSPEGDLITAKLATGLGTALRSQGILGARTKHIEALELFQEAYDLHHENQAGVILTAMQATDNLAFALRELGRADEAEDLLRSKIEDCRRELGGDHEHTLWALSTLASHLAKEGRLEEAEGLLRETRGHFSPVLGEDSHWVLVLTRAIAGIHLRRGELAQAARLYRHVLDARRRAGLDDLETFNARVDMAQVLARQGKLLQAESLYREQLEVRRRVDGPDYPFTIVTANELASFLFEYMPDKLDEVESMCRSMVEDLRRVLGDDHNHTFGAMYRLALALEARGKLDEAEDNYRGALAGRRRTIGPELTGTR
ncbi:MAG: tetratricopeptide repeat protein, partial [Planctomycetota bacterium]